MDSQSYFLNNYTSTYDDNNQMIVDANDCFYAMEDFAVLFSEWLIKNCDFQKHGVWLYKGMEMTQKELLGVFNHDVE